MGLIVFCTSSLAMLWLCLLSRQCRYLSLIPIIYSSSCDCIILSQLITHPTLCHQVHYSKQVTPAISAVSDHMHHHQDHCPVSITKSAVPPDVVSPTITTSSMHLPSNTTNHDLSSLPHSTLDGLTVMTKQYAGPQNSVSHGLSTERIAQVANMCVSSLQTDGIISQKLLNTLLQQGLICPSNTSNSCILSSTTPLD